MGLVWGALLYAHFSHSLPTRASARGKCEKFRPTFIAGLIAWMGEEVSAETVAGE